MQYHLATPVATVLTVYGIETDKIHNDVKDQLKLQQYLPFTVLKLKYITLSLASGLKPVATVLTVYGIETSNIW